jgi:hypothetical protein
VIAAAVAGRAQQQILGVLRQCTRTVNAAAKIGNARSGRARLNDGRRCLRKLAAKLSARRIGGRAIPDAAVRATLVADVQALAGALR